MCGDLSRIQVRVSRHQRRNHRCQHGVLTIVVFPAIFAFQFDADGKVVACNALLKPRLAGMPGSFRERHELHEFAVSMYQEVRGNPKAAYLGKVRMRGPVQLIHEQGLDVTAAEFTRRQTDTVNHQQLGYRRLRPFVTVRAFALPRGSDEPGNSINCECDVHQKLPKQSGTTIVTVSTANCQR